MNPSTIKQTVISSDIKNFPTSNLQDHDDILIETTTFDKPKKSSIIITFTLAFLQILGSILIIVGTKKGLEYGPSICLLNIENYYVSNGVWSFTAGSHACTDVIALSAILLTISFILASLNAVLIFKSNSTSRKLIYTLTGMSLFQIGLSLAIAIILSIGLSSTCSEFTKSGYSCENVFYNGFYYDGEQSMRNRRNIGLAWMALLSAWIMLVTWCITLVRNFMAIKSQRKSWA